MQVWLRGDAPTPRPPTTSARSPSTTAGWCRPLTVGDATCAVARLDGGDVLALPAAPRAHVYVATGALLRFSLAEPLAAGDAFAPHRRAVLEVTAAVPTDAAGLDLRADPRIRAAPVLTCHGLASAEDAARRQTSTTARCAGAREHAERLAVAADRPGGGRRR